MALRISLPGSTDGTASARRFGPAAQFALLSGPLLTMVDSSIVNVAVEPISTEMGAPLGAVEWVVSGYLLSLGTGLAMTSYLARRFGTVRVYAVGMAAFTFSSLLCAVAPGIWFLVAARILQGLTGATLVPLAMSMLMGGEGAAKNMSPLAGILLFLGPALGPSLGGILIGGLGDFGWRAIFLVNLPIGALAVAATKRLPDGVAPPPEANARLDVRGLVLIGLSLFFVLFGVERGVSGRWGEPLTVVSLLAGAVLFVAYLRASRRTEHPALDLSIMRNPSVALSFCLCGAASVAAWSIVFVLPVFLQTAQGHSPLGAGLALLPQGVLTGISTIFGATAAQRIGVRWTVVGGFTALVVASLGLLAIGADTPLWVTALILTARSGALGLVITPLVLVVSAPLRPDQQADANATFNVTERIMGSFGIGMLATLYSNRAAKVGPVPALHTVATIITIFTAGAVLAALMLPQPGATGPRHRAPRRRRQLARRVPAPRRDGSAEPTSEPSTARTW